MTAAEVHRLLGRPPFTSYEPTDSTAHIEYWLFTHTEFSEIPPAEAYVIWFTTDWRVRELRAPKQLTQYSTVNI
jgi:hypothetical protein